MKTDIDVLKDIRTRCAKLSHDAMGALVADLIYLAQEAESELAETAKGVHEDLGNASQNVTPVAILSCVADAEDDAREVMEGLAELHRQMLATINKHLESSENGSHTPDTSDTP